MLLWRHRWRNAEQWTHLCENSRVRWMLSLSINRTTMGFQCGAPAANQKARHPAKARYPEQREITQPGGRNYLCKCDLAGYEMEICWRAVVACRGSHTCNTVLGSVWTWSVHGRLHAKRKRLRFYAIPEMHLTLIMYNGSPAIIQRKSINVLTFMDLSTSCCEKFVWSQSRNDDFSAHSLQGKSFTAKYWYRIFHLCYFVRHFFHLDSRSCIFIVTSGSSVKQCRMSHLVSRRKCHRMIFS